MTASSTIERPAPAPAPAPRVAFATLAWAEARLLLRSPVLWTGAVVGTALGAAFGWTTMPTWETFTADSGMASFVFAGAAILAGHLAASRDHRSGAVEISESLPTRPWRRALGLLALAPVVALVATAMVMVQLLLVLPGWPVGLFELWALLAAVVTPTIGVVLGVAAGRWLPKTAAGPLVVVVTAAVFMSAPVFTSGNEGWWLFPAVIQPGFSPGMPRPVGWHLLYLLALLGVAVAAVLLRHRRKWPSVALVAALAAAGGTVVPQFAGEPEVITLELQEAHTGLSVLDCRTHTAVRYCALPHHAGWIPLWREAVEPIALAVPPAARPGLPMVRQIGNSWEEPTDPAAPREVLVSSRWGRHEPWARNSRAGLVAAFARDAVRVPLRTFSQETGGYFRCSGSGQLRTVAGLWLAAQALPDGAQRLKAHDISLSPVQYGTQDSAAAAALLAQPRERVVELLGRRWSEVTSAVPVGDTLTPLGVPGLTPAAPSDSTLAPCQ